MIEYWTHLTPTMKTFVGLGAISSVVLTLQMVLAMFGGDMDGLDADMEVSDVGEGGASGILSIRTIGAFFTGFGWSGAAMLQAGHGTGAATFVGIVVGSIFMALIFYLMAYLHSLRQEGTINYANAVGKIGSVYLPVPPHRKGIGQIEVLVQGRLKIVQAISDSDKKIGNRVAVRVTELVDEQTILVEPLENESPKES
jgi:hypothetical protein